MFSDVLSLENVGKRLKQKTKTVVTVSVAVGMCASTGDRRIPGKEGGGTRILAHSANGKAGSLDPRESFAVGEHTHSGGQSQGPPSWDRRQNQCWQ